jgi:hypothetical protein
MNRCITASGVRWRSQRKSKTFWGKEDQKKAQAPSSVTAKIAWPKFHRDDRTEVDYQVAAPAVTRTPNWHRATNSLNESADGRVATVATLRQERSFCPMTNKSNLLDSDRPFHGRRSRNFALSIRLFRGILSAKGIFHQSTAQSWHSHRDNVAQSTQIRKC